MKQYQSLEENLKNFEKKQMLVGIIGLLILICCSVIANRFFMQASAEQTAKLITRLVQTGDIREITLTLQDAKLDYFSKIKFDSKSLDRSFTFPPLSEFEKERSFWQSLLFEKIELDSSANGGAIADIKMSFEYNQFGFVLYAIGIWFILILVSVPQTKFIKNRISEQFEKDLEFQKKSTYSEVSQKVRHNINTPLAALTAMATRLQGLEKTDQVLFQGIVSQIRSLVKDLDYSNITESNGAEKNKFEEQPILHVLEESFLENKAAFKASASILTSIDENLASAKIFFAPHELRSIISNLVQNAVEAAVDTKAIKISAKDLINRVEITVEDAGKGIPTEVIARVTEKNFSFEKPKGTGLGLYHAKTFLEQWGGLLKIQSEVGIGTKVQIILPITSRVKWFTPRIKIKDSQRVIVLDDQGLQHLQWQMKLNQSCFSGGSNFFYNSEEFLDFKSEVMNSENIKNFVFLFDNRLKEKTTGLDLLKDLPDGAVKYLVTSDWQKIDIQKACEDFGIFLVSKDDLLNMPLVITSSAQKSELDFI